VNLLIKKEMGLREAFGRLTGIGNQGKTYPKISPDEVELASYKERERKDRIRKELGRYRMQDRKEMFGAGTIFKEKRCMLNQKNVFRK
jgi:hypothetical protein